MSTNDEKHALSTATIEGLRDACRDNANDDTHTDDERERERLIFLLADEVLRCRGMAAEAERLAADIPLGKLMFTTNGLLRNEGGQYVGPPRVCIYSSKDPEYMLFSTGDARKNDSVVHGRLVIGALRLIAKIAGKTAGE